MNIFIKFAAKCEEEAMQNNIKITVLSTDRNRVKVHMYICVGIANLPTHLFILFCTVLS